MSDASRFLLKTISDIFHLKVVLYTFGILNMNSWVVAEEVDLGISSYYYL